MNTIVPGSVAAAVMTRRTELLSPLRAQIKHDKGLDADTALALLDLVRDAISEAQADDDRRRKLVEQTKNLRGTVKGLLGKIDEMVALFEGRDHVDDDDDDYCA